MSTFCCSYRLDIFPCSYLSQPPIFTLLGKNDIMADVFSAVVAGAQALDYSIQFCEVLRRSLKANENKKKYQQNNEELIQVLEQISKTPLQAPDVTDYTQGLIDKVQEINIPSQPKKRDRLMATISFFFKQKQHEEDSAYLEQQKATLGLHISNSNTHLLGELSNILHEITAQQHIPEQTSFSTNPESQSGSTLPSTFQHSEFAEDRRRSGYITRRDLNTTAMPDKYVPITRYNTCPLNSQYNSSSQSNFHFRNGKNGQTGPSSSTQSAFDYETRGGTITSCETHTVTLKGNVQAADSFQVIGVQITSGTNVTDDDMIKATSAFRAHGNIHSGKGTQVVGQRVCAGGRPRKIAGQFCGNYHKGSGEQIVGLCFD